MIDNEQARKQILSAMQVNQVWGIGKKTAAKLNANNIYNALELANLSAVQVKQNFSIDIEKTVRELNGQHCIDWDQVRQPKQQIYSTRSFGQRIFDKSLLRQALSTHTATVAKKLRQQKSLANRMIIFAASSPFDKRPIYRKNLYQFVVPTNDTSVMLKAIDAVIDSLFVSNVAYDKVGVGCIELIGEEFWQHDLFDISTDNPQLMKCIDTINRRFGPNSITNAAQGIEQPWQMNRQFLSPNYTTNWQALPHISCAQ
ncbi:MAG: DUF4113 domain-containing protein [Gammaproteobacteria bacterium]|nr:DUF4113 domain-containing protein [Gammaproteobacteria bacterium]